MQEIAKALWNYNEAIGNYSVKEALVEWTSGRKKVVIAGQQLGWMGGPSLLIHKAVFTLALAKKLDAVPLFWLATEDHDIGEIDHTYLLDPLGNLVKKRIHFPFGSSVEDLYMTQKQLNEVQVFLQEMALPRLDVTLGDRYAYVMAKYLAKLFANQGLIFLEPFLLRPFARGFFKKEILYRKDIYEARKKGLPKGRDAVLALDEGSTHLYVKNKHGKRCKIKQGPLGLEIDNEAVSEKEVLSLIDNAPELFSCNAAARPLLQNLLFPVAAHVVGKVERAYLQELKTHHAFYGLSLPKLVLRQPITWISPQVALLLKKIGRNAQDPLPESWDQVFPLTAGLKELYTSWNQEAEKIIGADVPKNVLQKIGQRMVKTLKNPLARYRLAKKGLNVNALHLINQNLHPKHLMQERVLNFQTFQSEANENLIQGALDRWERGPLEPLWYDYHV